MAMTSKGERILAALSQIWGVSGVLRRIEAAAFRRHQASIKTRCNAAVFKEFGGVVAYGPFAGMRLSEELSWGADAASMLIGEYEREVQATLLGLDLRAYDAFVDVGCANGYYAVGMARLRPDWHVHAFDIMAEAREVTRKNAAGNGVADRVHLYGAAEHDALEAVLQPMVRPLVLMDIEGYEKVLLDPGLCPSLAKADILVEVHDRQAPGTGDAIRRQCASTHEITPIARQGRNPFRSAELCRLPETLAWVTISEGRSAEAGWLFLKARGSE